ncbi:MAG: YjbQ family protein [Candidatus Marinimicrobia bacterium]|nr:YjbQ family protein [Candidatus Neomarinimicrobiota bacterium]
MMKTIQIRTSERVELIDITSTVQAYVSEKGTLNGIIIIYVPHTTCGITINEHADPDVVRDIKMQLGKLAPENAGYHHYEGNSDSHVKSSLIGASETVIISNSQLLLGTWQGIFLCDFDGPRTRNVHLKIMAD